MGTHWRTRAKAVTLTISALLGLGALAGCTGSGGNSAVSTATKSVSKTAPSVGRATALLQGTLAALRSGGSVHVDISTTTSAGSMAYSDDATASGGRQIVTVNKTEHLTILFIAGVAYVQADTNGLGFFDVPQSQAKQFARKWIAVRPGDTLGTSSYADVTAGITLSSVATELKPSGGPATLAAPAVINGQRVVGVQAPLPATSQFPAAARDVLYMTDDSLLRPVLSEITNADGYTYQMSFSRWGETLPLTAPANTVPASSVTPVSSIT
ncbi:MAG TPA: hypothetical protein VGG54_17235 [Trebonia sp.]|jgi:hypothetical protein